MEVEDHSGRSSEEESEEMENEEDMQDEHDNEEVEDGDDFEEIDVENDEQVFCADSESEDEQEEILTFDDKDGNQWKSSIGTEPVPMLHNRDAFPTIEVNGMSPIELFKQFMSENIFEIIASCTNHYGRSKEDYWVDIEVEDIKAFVGVLIGISVQGSNKRSVKQIFCNNVASSVLARSTFTRRKFEKILKFIRFDDAPLRQQRLQETGESGNVLDMINMIFDPFIQNCKYC